MEDLGITYLPHPYTAMRTDGLLALLAHFTTCSKVSTVEKKWGGPEIQVGNKAQRLELVIATLEHIRTCTEATAVADTYPNLFTPIEEIPMAAQEPATPLPAALDIASGKLNGVILVVDIRGNDQHFDLLAVAQALPHMQLNRAATADLIHKIEVVPAQNWQDCEFDVGEEVNLYDITGNGQYLVIGAWAYMASEVRDFLERNGGHLRYNASEPVRQAPPWPMPQPRVPQQGRHAAGLAQNELDAEGGQLLADRTHGADTHDHTELTELPADADADDEHYDREVSPANPNEIFDDGLWLTKLQRLTLMVFGCANSVLLILGLGMSVHQHYAMWISMLIALIAGPTITVGTGALGAIVAIKFAERPMFAQPHQAQRILGTCGALIGWMIMTLVALNFLF